MIDLTGKAGQGEVTIITKSKLNIHMLDETSILHFSIQSGKCHQKRRTITIITIYLPPYSNQHPVTNTMFMDDITEWLSNILPKDNNIILAGDFNLHVNDGLDGDTITIIKTIEAMGLQQLVCSPTHKSGNMLDLIFTGITEEVKKSKH